MMFEDIFDVKDVDPEGKKFERGDWLNNVLKDALLPNPTKYCN